MNQGGKTRISNPKSLPKQTDNVSCGYYVLRYMKDLIDIGLENIVKKKKYSNSDIDEIKFLWADSVSGFIVFYFIKVFSIRTKQCIFQSN